MSYGLFIGDYTYSSWSLRGWLLLEHGYTQQETLLALLRDFGYRDVEGKKDLAGVPRMVQARWPGPVSD